ncbi:SseB family protein [Nocardioides faecalis]|uniref:SseB family protein n=1 Tax=Nocardioides faecalis TaxID=2803858 RepID=UPI0020BFC99F|nr:SseB family protein [Nocardioides faecalis]
MNHPPSERPDARRLQGSEYVDDDGSPDPALRTALAGYDAGTTPYPAVLAALAESRLVVPVVAILGETGEGAAGADGAALVTDKSSDMAAVLLTGADGRMALLAFSGIDSLAAWDPQARPVPVAAPLAAATAVQEGAAALVVDVAGPHQLVLAEDDLHRIAAGWRPVRLQDGGWGWLGAAPEGE